MQQRSKRVPADKQTGLNQDRSPTLLFLFANLRLSRLRLADNMQLEKHQSAML
jgi:hypothetical protein